MRQYIIVFVSVVHFTCITINVLARGIINEKGHNILILTSFSFIGKQEKYNVSVYFSFLFVVFFPNFLFLKTNRKTKYLIILLLFCERNEGILSGPQVNLISCNKKSPRSKTLQTFTANKQNERLSLLTPSLVLHK